MKKIHLEKINPRVDNLALVLGSLAISLKLILEYLDTGDNLFILIAALAITAFFVYVKRLLRK
jgi:hypothetical protein